MTSYTVTLDLPQDIYQQAERAARTTKQPVEQVIVNWIMPPPSSHDELVKEIAELESQGDEMLIQIARSVMPEDDVARLRELFAVQRARGLTEAEQREAAALVEKEDLYTLRRARALYLLKKRNALPDELIQLLGGTDHGIHSSTSTSWGY